MKKLFFTFLVLVFISSCVRRNLSMEGNWSTNEDYKKYYSGKMARMPIQNIPYVITYIEQNDQYSNKYEQSLVSKNARYSYNYYQKDINDMKKVLNSVTTTVAQKAYKDNPNIKLIYDKEMGEYVIDPSSLNSQIDIPDLNEKYWVNNHMQYKTEIPYKNAYAILQMKQSGYVPNEIYFKNMNVKNPINHKFDVYDEVKYTKTPKKNIYSLAGIDISKIANLIYEK